MTRTAEESREPGDSDDADAPRWLLGIDAGLTTVKAALVSSDGTESTVRSRETPTQRSGPNQREVELEALWSAVAETVRAVVDDGPVPPSAIEAVGVAGHGHGLYLLDGDGEPVRPGIRSTDNRATDIVAEWEADGTAATIRNRLGYAPFGAEPISLLTWIKRHEPDAYARINDVLFCKDYLKYRLTDRIATDEMEGSVFADPRTGEYATYLLDDLGLGAVRSALPEVVESWRTCGTITAEAAAETGLEPGTPVASGLHDVGAVTLGTGAYTPGQAVVIVGTWGQSIVVLDEPTWVTDDGAASTGMDPSGLTRRYLDGGWLRYKGNRSAAASLDWFVDEFGEAWRQRAESANVDAYAMYDRVVERVSPGAEGVLFHPYLHGSTDDPEATGGFYGLTADHGKEHMLRAIYEGVAIAGIEQLTQLAPSRQIDDVRLSGGGARSDVWAGMFADVNGDPVIVPAGEESGARGAAICAAIAADIHPDHASAVDRMVPDGRCHDPDPDAVETYREQRETFSALLSALRPLWDRLGPPEKD